MIKTFLSNSAVIASFVMSSASGAEMGALAYRYGVQEGNYTSPYSKSGTGVVQSANGLGWKCFGSAGAGAVAVQATSSFPNAGSPRGLYVRGHGYWFEQFVITAAGVPNGTLGEARFTLYPDGGLAVGPTTPNGTAQGRIFYRVDATIGANAQPNLSGSQDGDVRFWDKAAGYTVGGGDFTTSPQEHTILFRFGEVTSLTIYLRTESYRWSSEQSSVNAELRFRGWNGFDWVKVQGAAAPVNAFSAVSTTNLDMAVPTMSTFERWRTLYDLSGPMAEPDADPNYNGLSNRMEYALGLNPLTIGPETGLSGGMILQGGTPYLSLTYTRPRSGRPGDLSYVVERATALSPETWTGQQAGVTPVSVEAGPGALETVTVRSTTPVSGLSREFMKLTVVPVAPE